MRLRICVVGGGVIGMSSALQFVGDRRSVVVYDKGIAGREASWAGGGILSPLYPWRYPEAVNVLADSSAPLYRAWAEDWRGQGLPDPELLESGMLVLDEDESTVGKAWAARRGARTRLVDATVLRDLEPVLGREFKRAVMFPEVGQIRNSRLSRTLRQALLQSGAALHENAPVARILVEAGRVAGLELAGEMVAADRVVLAAGAWTPGLLPPDIARVPVRPVKGQMILLQGRPGLIRHVILYKGRYLIPRADGRILVGSTMEELGFDKTPTEAAARELRAAAEEIVPSLKGCPMIGHWAGLRPGSPDGVPFIGRHPDVEGLYLNVGHFRNGLCTAPASARLLADLMLGREPILDPAPYQFRPDENA